MTRFHKEGHPVCYNAYGVLKGKDMYERVFGDEEKLQVPPIASTGPGERNQASPLQATWHQSHHPSHRSNGHAQERAQGRFHSDLLCFRTITLKWSLARFSSMCRGTSV